MPTQSEPVTKDGETLRPAFPDVAPDERPYTKVSYGIPFDTAICKHVNGFLNVERVYIIASKSLASQTDNLKTLETALGDKHVGTWLGIAAHTPYDALIPIMNDMREKRADCLVTLGGGSIADGAKAIAYALENGVYSLEDMRKLGEKFIKITPSVLDGIGNPAKIQTIFCPTTLAGAEFSKFAGCTDPDSHLKVQITHPTMFASLLVLDGKLCTSTPDWAWVSTGVRAIDHCVENICSTNARPESDVACDRGLRRLVKSLFAYLRDPNDLDARLESQQGVNNAMTGLTLLVMCGASHGIGHMLGPLGVGHGQTSCILLPAVMKFNASVNQPQQDRVVDILWQEPEIVAVLEKHNLQRGSSDAGDALRAIFDELGMPRSLKDVGVTRDKWDTLAKNSLDDKFCQVNARPLETTDQVKEILEMVSGET